MLCCPKPIFICSWVFAVLKWELKPANMLFLSDLLLGNWKMIPEPSLPDHTCASAQSISFPETVIRCEQKTAAGFVLETN